MEGGGNLFNRVAVDYEDGIFIFDVRWNAPGSRVDTPEEREAEGADLSNLATGIAKWIEGPIFLRHTWESGQWSATGGALWDSGPVAQPTEWHSR